MDAVLIVAACKINNILQSAKNKELCNLANNFKEINQKNIEMKHEELYIQKITIRFLLFHSVILHIFYHKVKEYPFKY